jgi:NAD(P)-dependent dehydrogenase (short-subunit alcohol dehydrogenase family)
MMKKLDGKVAIITGAGSGIGRASALLFAEEGARVVIADNVVSGGEGTVKMIEEAGGEACFVKTDVSVEADVKRLVEVALDKYGKVDILFNNAGIVGKQVPTHEIEVADWDSVININLKGMFLGIKYTVPQMLKQGGGVIINTASAASFDGWPGIMPYCASKGGVLQLTKAVALDYAKQNIRVNCICPGSIWTPLVESMLLEQGDVEEGKKVLIQNKQPTGRLGKPEEIARGALFLACDDSSFVTGIALPVDGGQLAG